MGMVLEARMVTPDDIDAVRASPERLEQIRYDEDPDASRTVDVDKAWHGIHYLLTGTDYLVPSSAPPRRRRLFGRTRPEPEAPEPSEDPASWAVLGGEPVGEDEGFGPARVLTPEQVAMVAAALEPIDSDVLAPRADLDAMAAIGLYPAIWDEPDVFEEYLAPNYLALRDFYLEAARQGAGVLLWIS